jgi:Na+/melibiose symporter-like transporter
MAIANGAARERLPFWRAVLFSLAGFPVQGAIIGLAVYLPPHLTSVLGVPLAVVGTAWATVRLLDTAIDPLLGAAMDATRTPIGRYRPWMAAGIPLFMAAIGLLFFAPAGIGQAYLMGALIVYYLAYSILFLAQPAWGATLVRSYDERSWLYGLIAAVGFAAMIAVLAIPIAADALGRSRDAVHLIGAFLLVVGPLAIGAAVLATPERINPDHHHDRLRLRDFLIVLKNKDLLRLYAAQITMTLGPGWMSSLFIFFAKDFMRFTEAQASILLLVYIVAGLAGAAAAAKLATRIGKHRTLMVTAAVYALGLPVVLALPKGVVLAAVPIMLWCGVAGAGFDQTIRSMLADVADEVRLEQGRERTSLIYALNTLAGKLASAFAIGLTFPLLQWLGYQPKLGAANAPGAIRALGLTFVSGPIVFVALGAACMIGWRLTAGRHAEIRAALEARDAEAALRATGGEPAAGVAAAGKSGVAPA